MAGTVRAIDRKSVHQICSGQVVLNLATAVKELVENSLDAGANNIEIRLREYGSECLDVIDNGSGVEASNFQALTLKHHTSKLQDFSDLANVDTFGFRGEALSSLCALSDLSILTCHKSAKVGTRLEYDHDGKIIKQSPCPRQTGTTVTLQNLFSTLPVRHKEFLRNLKKEFTKMVNVLQAYCIISQGVKLSCTNQVGKGSKSVVVATNGNTNLRENISSVFGSKQLQKLLEVKQVEPSPDVCEEYSIKPDTQPDLFRISGYISQPDHGQGRSSTDRQYFFINRRPCDFPKVAKLVNEVYHTYNRHQYPMCVLDVSLSKDAVDVNLTPDKRKILVQEEKLLLAVIKTSLTAMFAPRSSTYQMNQTVLSPLTSSSTPSFKPSLTKFSSLPEVGNSSSMSDISTTLASLKRSFTNPNASKSVDSEEPNNQSKRKQPSLDRFICKPLNSSEGDNCKEPSHVDDIKTDERENISEQIYNNKNVKIELIEMENSENNDEPSCNKTSNRTNLHTPSDSVTNGWNFREEKLRVKNVENDADLKEVCEDPSGIFETKNDKESGYGSHDSLQTESSQENVSTDHSGSPTTEPLVPASADYQCNIVTCQVPVQERSSPESSKAKKIKIFTTDDGEDTNSFINARHKVTIPFSVRKLQQAVLNQQEECADLEDKVVKGVNFKAKISPSDNSAAENELSREISKDMFAKMEIIGQFNLGFIIAKLAEDLFIIDQHATDEKYNFETLQKNTVLQGQRLIQPMSLELTAVNESILLDNIEIFRKNGFEFAVNKEAPPTQKVKLTSLPVSKNWTFGKEDVDELVFMLSDSPGVQCRPSRVRQMFASRACRKSVMIGTALSHPDMTKLVKHMEELDQPWNCPHGRPTMRHLFNLNLLPD